MKERKVYEVDGFLFEDEATAREYDSIIQKAKKQIKAKLLVDIRTANSSNFAGESKLTDDYSKQVICKGRNQQFVLDFINKFNDENLHEFITIIKDLNEWIDQNVETDNLGSNYYFLVTYARIARAYMGHDDDLKYKGLDDTCWLSKYEQLVEKAKKIRT